MVKHSIVNTQLICAKMFELILQSRHKIDRYFGKIKCYYFLRTFIFVCCIIWIFFYTVFRCKSYINDLSTIIETKPCGAVQGITEENIFIFKGIPYAQPPIKNLRWQRPLELCHEDGSCWKGIYKADHFPNSCFQSRMPSSEDCLYLNIWTPILSRTEKLAVVVFLHGGCLLNGNGNMGLGYMPTSSFIAKSNIVFVSLNYRLNAFGYMALDVLSKRSQNSKSGNYGFWDQVQALKWVKDNIINFGGDPEKITIFGHSSGGTSLFTLLSSPYARGLFHRVWISSGSPLINVTLNEASKYNLPFLKNADCENADCLLRMPPNEVYNAIPMYEYPYWDPMDMIDLPTKGVITASLPIVDGDFLPYPPVEVWSRKEGIDVPIIIGLINGVIKSVPSKKKPKIEVTSQEDPDYCYWLFKSEPERRLENGVDVKFGIDDLIKCPNQISCWDGVRNYQARNFMRDKMKIGHLGFFYHSNCKEPGIAGIIKIIKESYEDHTQFDKKSLYYDSSASPSNPRWFLVDVQFVRKLKRFIPLSELKKVHELHKETNEPLKKMALFTRSRLSVQPVTKGKPLLV